MDEIDINIEDSSIFIWFICENEMGSQVHFEILSLPVKCLIINPLKGVCTRFEAKHLSCILV